jgi:S-DNA-T family DNA segregation ATPase FtsK/SpoIIIE
LKANRPHNKNMHSTTAPSFLNRRLREVFFILLAGLGIFIFLAFMTYRSTDPSWSNTGNGVIHNLSGPLGAFLADIFLTAFGYVAYFIPLAVIYTGWLLLGKKSGTEQEELPDYYKWLRFVGALLTLIAGCGLFSTHLLIHTHLPSGSGGIVGDLLGEGLIKLLSYVGASLIMLVSFLAGVTLFTGFSWLKLMDWIGVGTLWLGMKLLDLLKRLWIAIRNQSQSNKAGAAQSMPLKTAPTIEAAESPNASLKIIKSTEVKGTEPKESLVNIKKMETTTLGTTKPERGVDLFAGTRLDSLPSLSLLEKPLESKGSGYSTETLQQLSKLVEAKLREFGIEVKVVAVYPGPVITRFELDLAPGIKVSKLSSLSKDIARSLSFSSVRIVEVIPGKSFVGIEIPNQNREIVRLREILSSDEYSQASSPLSLGLGKDIAGEPFVVDLAKMPHLLVAGTTGSGKSVGLNAMLLSFLYKSTPDMVRLIMVDPKMLELAVYDGIPHLLTPVITDMKRAANALRWCIGEMERRYQLMSALGVRNLKGYNEKVNKAIESGNPLNDPLWTPVEGERAPGLTHLPYIVVLIDEFADMMMVVGKKVDELIARLAQKARAAGIHLILATQRPSVDVITGLIKANIPTRIAFQVSSRIDSRTILDQMGAEQLLGHGDMLYMEAGMGHPIRIHGAFVADDEVHKVVNDLKAKGKPAYLEEITEGGSDVGGPRADVPGLDLGQNENGGVDELFDQAVAIVAKTRRASISNVQRRLKIGYNRAARILEEMEVQGMVSTMEVNGSREVLLPPPSEDLVIDKKA